MKPPLYTYTRTPIPGPSATQVSPERPDEPPPDGYCDWVLTGVVHLALPETQPNLVHQWSSVQYMLRGKTNEQDPF